MYHTILMYWTHLFATSQLQIQTLKMNKLALSASSGFHLRSVRSFASSWLSFVQTTNHRSYRFQCWPRGFCLGWCDRHQRRWWTGRTGRSSRPSCPPRLSSATASPWFVPLLTPPLHPSYKYKSICMKYSHPFNKCSTELGNDCSLSFLLALH